MLPSAGAVSLTVYFPPTFAALNVLPLAIERLSKSLLPVSECPLPSSAIFSAVCVPMPEASIISRVSAISLSPPASTAANSAPLLTSAARAAHTGKPAATINAKPIFLLMRFSFLKFLLRIVKRRLISAVSSSASLRKIKSFNPKKDRRWLRILNGRFNSAVFFPG